MDMRTRNHASENGQATMILLCCMIIAVVAITMLLARIGHADDLRTQAKQASDAAALAAASTLRTSLAVDLQSGTLSYMYVIDSGSGKTAAQDFAERNHAVLTDYESAAGAVKVSVRGRRCMKDEKKPKYQAEEPCIRTDTDKAQKKDGERTAIASSAAGIDMPSCGMDPNSGIITCTSSDGGTTMQTNGMPLNSIANLFDVHLTDTYNPVDLFSTSADGGGTSHLPAASDPQRHANEEMGRKMARDQYGWTGKQWDCLDQLWLHESGWDHHADNPTSTAYGIPQALPGSKMGAGWQNDPKVQIGWGLKYIKDRYSTPCGAWSFWQRTDARPNPGHWY